MKVFNVSFFRFCFKKLTPICFGVEEQVWETREVTDPVSFFFKTTRSSIRFLF